MQVYCKYINQEYRATLRYSGSTQLKVDTGSPVTIIDLNTMATLLKCDINLLKNWVNKHSNLIRTFVSYTGNNVDTIPCRLRNVYLEGIRHNCLFFFLNISEQVFTPLLGMDYISNCKIEGSPKQALLLDKLSDEKPYDNVDYIEVDMLSFESNSNFNDAMSILSMSNKIK